MPTYASVSLAQASWACLARGRWKLQRATSHARRWGGSVVPRAPPMPCMLQPPGTHTDARFADEQPPPERFCRRPPPPAGIGHAELSRAGPGRPRSRRAGSAPICRERGGGGLRRAGPGERLGQPRGAAGVTPSWGRPLPALAPGGAEPPPRLPPPPRPRGAEGTREGAGSGAGARRPLSRAPASLRERLPPKPDGKAGAGGQAVLHLRTRGHPPPDGTPTPRLSAG